MAINVAVRPAALNGCVQSWGETSVPNTIRSQMEFGTIKARRRTTAIIRTGAATVTLPASQYAAFRQWFEQDCQSGVLPTRFRLPPDNLETVWRFTDPPAFTWIRGNVFRASFNLEQLPEWVGL